mgnify:FL=1
MKNVNVFWSLSLLIISVCTIILAGSNIIGIELNDVLTRVLGILDLVCLPVLVFTTIKKIKK